jgi:hypothetical protein
MQKGARPEGPIETHFGASPGGSEDESPFCANLASNALKGRAA